MLAALVAAAPTALAEETPFSATRAYMGTVQGDGAIPSLVRRPKLGDLDNDGDLDILVVMRQDPQIFWLENLGLQGGRLAFDYHLISDSAVYPEAPVLSDIDGDGDLDVILFHSPSKISAWINDGATPPQFTERFLFQSTGDPLYIFAGDVDTDGDTDLVTCHTSGDKLQWHERTGSSGLNFVAHTISTGPSNAQSSFQEVAVVDLDLDGRNDVVTVNQTSSAGPHVVWYRRTDEPGVVFQENPLYTGSAGAHSVVAQDMNGDGALDIVYCGAFDDRVAVLATVDGTPAAFESIVLSQDPDPPFVGADGLVNFPRTVRAADIDADGDRDIVVIGDGDDQVGWFDCQDAASQTFEHRVISIDPDGLNGPQVGFAHIPYGLEVGDLDGDGDIDLVVASRGDQSITVWENRTFCREDIDGSGLIDFGDVNAVVGAFNTSFGDLTFDAAADLDGDGLVSFADLNILLSYFNQGCGAVQ